MIQNTNRPVYSLLCVTIWVFSVQASSDLFLPLQINKCYGFETIEGWKEFITPMEDFKLRTEDMRWNASLLGATFKVVSALNGNDNRVSLQSLNFPSRFVRHLNYTGFLHECEEEDEECRNDATWAVGYGMKAATGEETVSFQSDNFSSFFLRRSSSRIAISEVASVLSRKEASWIFLEVSCTEDSSSLYPSPLLIDNCYRFRSTSTYNVHSRTTSTAPFHYWLMKSHIDLRLGTGRGEQFMNDSTFKVGQADDGRVTLKSASELSYYWTYGEYKNNLIINGLDVTGFVYDCAGRDPWVFDFETYNLYQIYWCEAEWEAVNGLYEIPHSKTVTFKTQFLPVPYWLQAADTYVNLLVDIGSDEESKKLASWLVYKVPC